MILLEITGYSEYSSCSCFSNVIIDANDIIVFGEPEKLGLIKNVSRETIYKGYYSTALYF